MKNTIESSWDYYRKLNLILINIVILCIMIGLVLFQKQSIIATSILFCFFCFSFFLLFLQKSIFIEKDKISGYHTFFGIKIKRINSFLYSNNSIITTKKYKSNSQYQKGNSIVNSKYDPELHVEEDIFEILINKEHFITLYTKKGYKKFNLLINE